MKNRSQQFMEQREQQKLQAAWDRIAKVVVENTTGAHTCFVGTVQPGHSGYVVLYTPESKVLIKSTDKAY